MYQTSTEFPKNPNGRHWQLWQIFRENNCLHNIDYAQLFMSLIFVFNFRNETLFKAGIVCIVAAGVLILIGVITAVLTCIFVGRVATEPVRINKSP